MSDPHSPTGTTTDRADNNTVVVCANEQDEVSLDPDRYAALATNVLVTEGRVGELTLTFIERDEIAALNAEHMGVDGATDVLSFPLDAAGDDSYGTTLLGDVVVCPTVAAQQAPTHAGTLDDELALLVVHGVLHVLGWDHATPVETVAMRARERELLTSCFWHDEPPVGFRQDTDDDVVDPGALDDDDGGAAPPWSSS